MAQASKMLNCANNAPPRILMVIAQYYPIVGGAEVHARCLAKKLRLLDMNVTVLTGHWHRWLARREQIDDIPVLRNFTLYFLTRTKGLWRFNNYIYMLTLFWCLIKLRKEYDVLHIHNFIYSAFVSVLAAKLLSKKTIVTTYGSGASSELRSLQRTLMGRWKARFLLKHMDLLVCLHQEIAREFKLAGLPEERCVIIPNGIDTSVTTHRNYANIGRQILYVGRLWSIKGVDILLRAWQHVLNEEPNFTLTIVGDGGDRGKLERLSLELGISKTVAFTGQVQNVESYLQQADIFVLPSRAEGLSVALLEAMGAALPCIVTDLFGNRVLIEHERNGLIVPVDDEVKLAGAILTLARNKDKREELGRCAARTISEQYNMSLIATKYISCYRSLST